jgi:hypothetical protein
MDRRAAVLVTVSMVLDACGGGGGGGPASTVPDGSASLVPTPAPAPAPAPAPTPTPAPPSPAIALSPNIAAWGDSLTPAFALNLQVLVPDRSVLNGGFLGFTSTQIAANQLADTEHTHWINVFWYGHNNQSDPVTIKADIAASIAHLSPGNRRFIVLGMLNEAKPEEIKGGALYPVILGLNADLAALYPDNYIDIRTWLVSHDDPSNPQDVIDFGNDVVPSSLRYDEIHLRNEGSVLVAQKVKAFIDAKGW